MKPHRSISLALTIVLVATLLTTALAGCGKEKAFEMLIRIDTPIEVEYYRHGGILQMVLRQMLQ